MGMLILLRNLGLLVFFIMGVFITTLPTLTEIKLLNLLIPVFSTSSALANLTINKYDLESMVGFVVGESLISYKTLFYLRNSCSLWTGALSTLEIKKQDNFNIPVF